MVTWRVTRELLRDFHTNRGFWEAERATMGKGRLVKARFPDDPVPNVSWFKVPLGNCRTCQSYAPGYSSHPTASCLHAKVTPGDFTFKWSERNDCPYYQTGASPIYRAAAAEEPGRLWQLMVLQALGLAKGKPQRRVEILQDARWTPWAAAQAQSQQDWFLGLARFADSGEENPKDSWEYVDMADALPPIQTGEEPEGEGD